MTEDVFGIVGTVVAGAYHVEAVVAEGGFGVVYRAQHSGFRAAVALKCLKVPQQLSSAQEEQFLEQFRAEAELLFRLSASIPTVVRPLHVDAITLPDGRFVPFMALEWLEGETLDAIAERRRAEGQPPLPMKKLVRLLTPVARALERAHNFQGPDGPISIVHRDLKPENIFIASVAGEEVPKILDFGIGKAKSLSSQVAGRASQTESAFSSFTPAYGAPEQWVPKRFGQTGPWTDVWGLAISMVEVLAGRTIIDGDHAAMMGTALDPRRRPTPRNEGLEVPDEVEAVFVRALTVDPRDRYRDAGVFWNELLAALGMRADGKEAFAPSPRDLRAEAGAVPRVDVVEAVGNLPPSTRGGSGSRPRIGSGASEVATLPADAALAAGVYPDVSTEARSPAGSVPDLAMADIPDLALGGAASAPKPVRRTNRPPAHNRALDFDDSPSQVTTLELEVDLEPGERPSLRVPPSQSRPDWPAVNVPGAEGPVRRGSTQIAAVPDTRRPLSGAYPVVGSVPPPGSVPPGAGIAASVRPGRTTSSAHLPAVHPSSAPNWPIPEAPPIQFRPMEKPPPSPFWRIAPGAILIVLSIVVTLGDQWYAGSSGQVFTIAGLRATWIAGILMAAGVVVLAIRLIPSSKS
jgi:serine/threonine protein kinase